MAIFKMTPVKADYNAITKVDYEAATSATDGFKLEVVGSDEYSFILVTNGDTTAKKITVKAPTKGSYASATSDLEVILNAGETAVIRVESARYVNTDKTLILVPESTAVKAVAIY